jgi:plastocyanin
MSTPRLLALLALPALAGSSTPDAGVAWAGESVPLPIAVRTPEDLAFKAAAEKQYLVFNLLVKGKVAWDAGDFARAADAWESLLRTPQLPADLEALLRPLAKAARERAGGSASAAPLPALEPQVTVTPTETDAPSKTATHAVSGTVSGGGTHGPGGAVVVLRRADGPTPKPKAARVKAIVQKDKRFVPRVLAVPVGATVEFRNEDDILHNVFSLSKPNDFDLGLYGKGITRERVFSTPGPVNLLCNIHSSMGGYVYVVDSPWYAQADGSGRFTIKGVPAGRYEVEVWHEWAARPVKEAVTVAGATVLSLSVDGDKRPPAFVPDKAGKPRQPQLGY